MDSQIDASDDPQDGLAELLPPSRALVPAPVGAAPEHVRAWFDSAVEASEPVVDGTLASERDAADTYRRMAKADNTRRAYRAAVRAWCAWCARHDLPPLPASGQDVAAFLAGERGRKLSPETLKLRRAAIRYLHRAAGCPVPTDDVCVSETMAGITRDAARKGVVPRKKVAATATILRRLLAPIPATCAACATGPSCWSASPARCGARSWRRSASSTWRRPTAASGSPCRRPRASRPTR